MTDDESVDQRVFFWPVGKGDSTTIAVDADHWMQVDLHHQASADDDDATCAAVVDRLVEILPERDGKPYLSAFALTHADQDHCRGFSTLLESDIVVGEIWATPRLWREYRDSEDDKLCDDAQAFHEEVKRRVDACVKHKETGTSVPSGDRVRIIGNDEDFTDEDDPETYLALADEQRSSPGDLVTTLDGDDVSDSLEVFIHAPFKDDCAKPRNATSLAMHLTLKHPDGAVGRLFLLGDLAYKSIIRIFEVTKEHDNDGRLVWDILLSAHHCSKRVMYAPNEETDEEELKQDVLDELEESAGESAYIVASCGPFPEKDGDNPPYLKARHRYEELSVEGFLVVCPINDDTAGRDHVEVRDVAQGGASPNQRRTEARAGRLGACTQHAPQSGHPIQDYSCGCGGSFQQP